MLQDINQQLVMGVCIVEEQDAVCANKCTSRMNDICIQVLKSFMWRELFEKSKLILRREIFKIQNA
jgi:hypothetical protein